MLRKQKTIYTGKKTLRLKNPQAIGGKLGEVCLLTGNQYVSPPVQLTTGLFPRFTKDARCK